MTSANVTLLVVDDNEMNRDMLSRRLERKGYDVVTAADGSEALRLVEENDFALVLLDIEMPGLSGLDVLATLRGRYSPAQLPIIMVTARQQSRDVVEALQSGANDYVTKPIDLAIALARIETQLARRQAEAALQESEQRHALAVRGANDGLWDWDLRTNEIYFSPRWKQILGYGDAECPSSEEAWLNRVHPDDLTGLRQAIDAHLAGRTAHLEHEHRIRHRDGHYRWMLVRGAALRSGSTACRLAGSLTDIHSRKLFEERLRRDAVTDPLTGLPNLNLFRNRLRAAIERAKRRRDYLFAVLFLDVDRFKHVNDSLGHLLGDQLLVSIAERLENSLRSTDAVARLDSDHTLARLGGDEFAILLEDIHNVSDVMRVADRIQQNLGLPFELDGRQVFTSVSIGATTSETGYDEPQELLRDADTAMYRAKALGKARCEVFDTRMRDQAVARLELETGLRTAVERQEFELFYQPIVSLREGTIAGVEALVRWRHQDRGLVLPAAFIAVAEETGLILPMSAWILRQACSQLRAWQMEFGTGQALTIHVNLSGKQFAQPDLTGQIYAILGETGLEPSSLRLELTESAIVENLDAVVRTLQDLQALGVRIAIDDFGTGYSSLSYLHRLPISSLKIDSSFVSAMSTDCSKIIRAIVGLAQALRLEVVAEGVETPEQLAQLIELGCEYGQGNLFSPAVDAAGCRALLSAALTKPGFQLW